jgi:hypothetical protein
MTVGWTVFMTVGWTVLQLLVLPVFLAFLEVLPTNRVGGHVGAGVPVGAGDTVGAGVLADFLSLLFLDCLAFFNMRESSLHEISDGSSPLLR